MYTEEDKIRAKQGLTKMLVINVIIFLGTLALAVAGMVLRYQWLAMGGLALCLCATYCFLSVKTTPWYKYYKFIKDMFEGRSRETVGDFVECSDEIRLADGVQVHDFLVKPDDQEENLLYYWDDDKPRMQFKPGDRVKVTSFGRFVRDIALVTEE